MHPDRMEVDGAAAKRKASEIEQGNGINVVDFEGMSSDEKLTCLFKLLSQHVGVGKATDQKLAALDDRTQRQEQYIRAAVQGLQGVDSARAALEDEFAAYVGSDIELRSRVKCLMLKGVKYADGKGGYRSAKELRERVTSILLDPSTGLSAADIGKLADMAGYYLPKFSSYNIAFRVEDTEVSERLFKIRNQLRSMGYILAVELTQPEHSRKTAVNAHPAFNAAVKEALEQSKGPIKWVLDKCYIGKGPSMTVWSKSYIDQLDAAAAAAAQEGRAAATKAAAAATVQEAAATGEVVVTKEIPAGAVAAAAAGAANGSPAPPLKKPLLQHNNSNKPTQPPTKQMQAAGASSGLGNNRFAALVSGDQQTSLGSLLLHQATPGGAQGAGTGGRRG